MPLISTHARLHPARQRLIAWFVRLMLFMTVSVSLVMLVTSLLYGLPLLFITIIFLWAVNMPLFFLTSLHPSIEVHDEGLRVIPLVWPAQMLPWEQLLWYTPHTMLKPPPPSRSLFQPKIPQEGIMLGTTTGAWHYRVIGFFAGFGVKPIFAATNTTHANYDRLRQSIEQHLPAKS